MASSTMGFGVSPISTVTTTTSLRKHRHKLQVYQPPRNLDVLSSESDAFNRASSSVSVETNQNGSAIKDVVKSKVPSSLSSRVVDVDDEEAGFAPLWDDGYGNRTVEDYFAASKEICKFDGGPPRWFCPIECIHPSKDSPTMMFLPGKPLTTISTKIIYAIILKIINCLSD